MVRWQTAERKERYFNSRYFKALCDFERKLIREAVETAGGDITAAAALLEIDEETIKQRIIRLGGVLEGMPLAKVYTGRWVPRSSIPESLRSNVESNRKMIKERRQAAKLAKAAARAASASTNEVDDKAPDDDA